MLVVENRTVTVIRGDPLAPLWDAPIEAASEVLVVDVGGVGGAEKFQPLIYRPVDVNSFDDMIEIRSHTSEGLRVHREMYKPHISFEDGQTVARGFEETREGNLIRAIWFINNDKGSN